MIRSIVSMSAYLAVTGCSSSLDNAYFPHEKGLTWFYQVKQLTMTEPIKYKMINTSHGTKDIDGTHTILKQMFSGEMLQYTYDSKGVYRIDREGNRKILFKYPLQAGTQWQANERPYLMERSIKEINAQQNSMPGLSLSEALVMNYSIDSVNESVDVPAGRFHSCMKITGRGSCSFSSVGSFARKIDVNVEHTDWYCPGAGLVKVDRKENSERVSLKSVYYTIELERLSH